MRRICSKSVTRKSYPVSVYIDETNFVYKIPILNDNPEIHLNIRSNMQNAFRQITRGKKSKKNRVISNFQYFSIILFIRKATAMFGIVNRIPTLIMWICPLISWVSPLQKKLRVETWSTDTASDSDHDNDSSNQQMSDLSRRYYESNPIPSTSCNQSQSESNRIQTEESVSKVLTFDSDIQTDANEIRTFFQHHNQQHKIWQSNREKSCWIFCMC